MKNVLNSIISRLSRTKEKISELKYRSIETSQTEMSREKNKKIAKHPRTLGQFQKVKYMLLEYQKENKKNEAEKIL